MNADLNRRREVKLNKLDKNGKSPEAAILGPELAKCNGALRPARRIIGSFCNKYLFFF